MHSFLALKELRNKTVFFFFLKKKRKKVKVEEPKMIIVRLHRRLPNYYISHGKNFKYLSQTQS